MSAIRHFGALAATFGLSAAACVGSMSAVDTRDCMERNVDYVEIPILYRSYTRDDKINDDCVLASAAKTIASIRRADGSQDMLMARVAVNIYDDSHEEVQKFMRQMLEEQGTTIKQLKKDVKAFEIEYSQMMRDYVENGEEVVCAPDRSNPAVFNCETRKSPAPVAVPAAPPKDRPHASRPAANPRRSSLIR